MNFVNRTFGHKTERFEMMCNLKMVISTMQTPKFKFEHPTLRYFYAISICQSKHANTFTFNIYDAKFPEITQKIEPFDDDVRSTSRFAAHINAMCKHFL